MTLNQPAVLEPKLPTEVVGTFPKPGGHPAHRMRPRRAQDEWQLAEHRYLSENSMVQLNPLEPTRPCGRADRG